MNAGGGGAWGGGSSGIGDFGAGASAHDDTNNSNNCFDSSDDVVSDIGSALDWLESEDFNFDLDGESIGNIDDIGFREEVDSDEQFVINDAAWSGCSGEELGPDNMVVEEAHGTTNSAPTTKKNINPKKGCSSSGVDDSACKKPSRVPRSYATERWQAPPLFRPVRIPSDSPELGGVTLGELIDGDYKEAMVASYLFDAKFLLESVPKLREVPLLIIQGMKETKAMVKTLREYVRIHLPRAELYTPKTIHIGLHHSKMILLKYDIGVRVVIMTCNIRNDCWGGRCQAAWYQDFPLKANATAAAGKGKGKERANAVAAAASKGRGGEEKAAGSSAEEKKEDSVCGDNDDVVDTSEFEETLIDYFDHVGGPAASWARSLRAYDFSSASAVLIPSVPGKHSGKNLYKYGHMRVRAVLEREEVHVRPNKHRVLFQPASIMSLSIKPYKWLGEITESFMAEKPKKRGDVAEIDVPPSSEPEEEDDGKNVNGNMRKKPLGHPSTQTGPVSLLMKIDEKMKRKEAIHRRNVLGILEPRKQKPPKRLGKKALKRKRREEAQAAAREALIKYVGKERKVDWYHKFLRVLWPTEEDIRLSNLGWESGVGMPCLTTTLFEGGYRKCDVNFHLNRVMREMRPILSTWRGAKGMNRADAMPHLNTYCRYRELERGDGSLKMSKDGLAWFMLGSHSLHRMAWGYLELINPPQRPKRLRVKYKPLIPFKPKSIKPYVESEVQLDVKSFDMSILFLPSKIPPKKALPVDYESDDSADGDCGHNTNGGGAASNSRNASADADAPFSCDPGGILHLYRRLTYRWPAETPRARLRTLPLGLLPVPYQLPPKPYEYTRIYGYRVVDRPWCWNRDHPLPDTFGKIAKKGPRSKRH